jgi:hypothetical protein
MEVFRNRLLEQRERGELRDDLLTDPYLTETTTNIRAIWCWRYKGIVSNTGGAVIGLPDVRM